MVGIDYRKARIKAADIAEHLLGGECSDPSNKGADSCLNRQAGGGHWERTRKGEKRPKHKRQFSQFDPSHMCPHCRAYWLAGMLVSTLAEIE